MLDAIVFDFDGLVCDTESPELRTWQEVFAEHGVELPASWWSSIVGTAGHRHPVDVLAELAGAPVDRDAVLELRRQRHRTLVADQPCLPGVVELLGAADAAGVALAVASSSTSAWVEGNLRRLGLLERFAAVRGRDHVALPKPAPDVYLAACAAVGASPARSVALEDSPHGVAAACAAGLAVVAVPNPVTASLDLSAADAVVGSVAELSLQDLAALVALPD